MISASLVLFFLAADVCADADRSTCVKAIEAAHDQHDDRRALELAERSCMGRHEAVTCAWAAHIAYVMGDRATALEHAKKSCHLDGDCSWAARAASELHLDEALTHARTGCDRYQGAACSWMSALLHKQGKKEDALTPALKGCSLRDYGACTWAARIARELGLEEEATTQEREARELSKQPHEPHTLSK
jgi:hypothetical protein